MVINRVVILPTHRNRAFGHISMPDGSSALVVNKNVHENALRSADKKLGEAIKSIKDRGENDGGKGRAA